MVYRFEMASHLGRCSILQCMEPWLHNIELVDEGASASAPPTEPAHLQSSCSTNPVLPGNGWGSVDSSHVILHNLLYITAKVSVVDTALDLAAD